MSKYLLHGKLTAKQGHKEELAAILIEASQLVATANGCKLYVIGFDSSDENSVFITEIWNTKDDHDNSLKADGVRELILKAMPLLDGQPTKGQEIEILGGIGI
jgi:quinol monooxygenase YgiN